MALFALASALLIAVVIVSVPALDNLAELLWLKIRVLFGL
jgi:hypothetical protein